MSERVLRVDHDHWGQTQTDLREMALSAAHARSRERFLALYDIAEGASATEVAMHTGRQHRLGIGNSQICVCGAARAEGTSDPSLRSLRSGSAAELYVNQYRSGDRVRDGERLIAGFYGGFAPATVLFILARFRRSRIHLDRVGMGAGVRRVQSADADR